MSQYQRGTSCNEFELIHNLLMTCCHWSRHKIVSLSTQRLTKRWKEQMSLIHSKFQQLKSWASIEVEMVYYNSIWKFTMHPIRWLIKGQPPPILKYYCMFRTAALTWIQTNQIFRPLTWKNLRQRNHLLYQHSFHLLCQQPYSCRVILFLLYRRKIAAFHLQWSLTARELYYLYVAATRQT